MSDSVVDTVRLRGDASEPERFAILDEAGAGGMGIVYRARSLTNDAVVALKVMNLATGDPARFALETEVLAKLDHENIVGYHGHGTTREGKPYLAMEWLEGETLDAVVGKGALPAVETVRVGRAIAAALVHAHAAGVIHRDLKPSNVFVTKSGAIKLLDFGIARIVDLGRGLTSTGQVVGTPGFMAPEQARDDQEVDGRADLFALGCVLYFALAGRRPFEASSTAGYLTKLLFEAPPSLSTLAPKTPPALIDLVMRLLARERADRPASAEVVLAELETVLDAPARTPAAPSDRTLASPATPPRAEAKPAGTRRWLAIGVAVASAVALGYAIRPHDDRAPTTPSATASAATMPSASASAPPDDRPTVLRRACREWAAALVRAQRDDGSFSGEQHRPASGWDSAQQLFALARAKHACDAPEPSALERGARALDRYRTDAGWTGLGPTPAAELPATAWAALAGATLVRDGVDPGGARGAIALVRAATKPSGGFAFVKPSERVDLYSSVLGTWALVDASDDPANAGPARTAASWLAGALANDRALRGAAGLEEQALVVVLEAWRRKVVDLDPAVVEGVARDLIARCALAGGSCTRPLAEDDAIPLRPDGDAGDGSLISLWHPWLTLATDALLREGSIALPPDARGAIGEIAAWSARELTAAIAIVGVAPPYKLAEYLLVVSALVER